MSEVVHVPILQVVLWKLFAGRAGCHVDGMTTRFRTLVSGESVVDACGEDADGEVGATKRQKKAKKEKKEKKEKKGKENKENKEKKERPPKSDVEKKKGAAALKKQLLEKKDSGSVGAVRFLWPAMLSLACPLGADVSECMGQAAAPWRRPYRCGIPLAQCSCACMRACRYGRLAPPLPSRRILCPYSFALPLRFRPPLFFLHRFSSCLVSSSHGSALHARGWRVFVRLALPF